MIFFNNGLFKGCSKLTIIIDLNPIPQGISDYSVFEGVPEDAVIYIPKGSLEAYRTAEGWDYFSDFRELEDFDDAVESVSGDDSTPVEVYTLNGVSVAHGACAADLESLPAGFYVIRQGSKTRKIMVK